MMSKFFYLQFAENSMPVMRVCVHSCIILRNLFSHLSSRQAYKKVMDTHSPVPDYYHKNYALACEKMARNSDLSPHESGIYLREAVKHFQLYVESGSDDPQMSVIRNAIDSLRNQL